jgi:hypothetical protein
MHAADDLAARCAERNRERLIVARRHRGRVGAADPGEYRRLERLDVSFFSEFVIHRRRVMCG